MSANATFAPITLGPNRTTADAGNTSLLLGSVMGCYATTMALCLTSTVWLLRYRGNKLLLAQSPSLLVAGVAGVAVSAQQLTFLTRGPAGSVCGLQQALARLGQLMTLSALSLRQWRVGRIIKGRLNPAPPGDRNLFFAWFATLALGAVTVGLWLLIRLGSKPSLHEDQTCRVHLADLLLLTAWVLYLGWCICVAVRSRDAPTIFNDATNVILVAAVELLSSCFLYCFRFSLPSWHGQLGIILTNVITSACVNLWALAGSKALTLWSASTQHRNSGSSHVNIMTSPDSNHPVAVVHAANAGRMVLHCVPCGVRKIFKEECLETQPCGSQKGISVTPTTYSPYSPMEIDRLITLYEEATAENDRLRAIVISLQLRPGHSADAATPHV